MTGCLAILQGLTTNTSDLPPAMTTPQDGWDFDCDWDNALISPDGDAATQGAADATAAAAAPADQSWVGFGPTSDITSSAAAPTAPSGGGGGVPKSGNTAQRQSSQPHVSYPLLFQTGGGGRSRGTQPLSATADIATARSRSRDRSPFSQEEGSSKMGTEKLHASGGNGNGPVITADSTWEEVQQVLGDGGRATIHSRGFASNPFGPTLVYGYKGVAFEALKNGHLAGLTLFEA